MFSLIYGYLEKKNYDIELMLGITAGTLIVSISLSFFSLWFFTMPVKWGIYMITAFSLLFYWVLIKNSEYSDKYNSEVMPIINSFIDEDLKNNILPKYSIEDLHKRIEEADVSLNKNILSTLFTKTLIDKFVSKNLKNYISIWPYKHNPEEIPDNLITGLHHIFSEYRINITPMMVKKLATKKLIALQEEHFKQWFLQNNKIPEEPTIYDWVNAYVDTFENNLNYIENVKTLTIEKNTRIDEEQFKKLIYNEIYLRKKTTLARMVSWNMYLEKPIQFITIEDIDKMEGADKGVKFESILSQLFLTMGYDTVETPQNGDYGADLIVSKFGKKIAVQAKCYSDSVGLSAVQEAVSAMNYYDCQYAMVITNNTYTSSAINLAEKNNVILWDRTKLIEQIDTYSMSRNVLYSY